MGTTGCVSFQFEEKGSLIISREDFPDLDEEAVMMDALEAGAEDFAAEEDSFEINTSPEDYITVREQLEKQKYEFADVSIGPVPTVWARLDEEEMVDKMEKMIDRMEELDDVQEVFHNWEQD